VVNAWFSHSVKFHQSGISSAFPAVLTGIALQISIELNV